MVVAIIVNFKFRKIVMKNIKLILVILSFIGVGTFYSCTDSIDDLVTENAALGGLVNVETPLLSYVIGTPDGYKVKLKIFQGAVKTNEVNVLKAYQNASGERSNETLLKTVAIADSETSFIEFEVSFDELIQGLSLNGSDLSANDQDYAIGDFWELTYETQTSESKSHRNRNTTKVAVSGKYAGIYTVVESAYIHPTAGDQGGWNGESVVIESIVDAFTYNILANGPFTTDDNPNNNFVFVVNDDNSITIPKEWAGEMQTLWGSDELATCAVNPMELPDVCGGTDFVDPTDGGEQVTLSHGYIRDTGTRQFRYKLIKNQ